MANNDGYELGWDSEIEKDSEFSLVPEDDYDFEVISYERGRHNGSDKLPPCNKAVVNIKVNGSGGSTIIKHNLFLHTITEGMLCAFFAAIGQRKHGEKLKMNWNSVPGSTGRCRVYVDKWANDDGKEFESNKVKKFYDPEDKPKAAATTAPASYQAGKF